MISLLHPSTQQVVYLTEREYRAEVAKAKEWQRALENAIDVEDGLAKKLAAVAADTGGKKA